MPMPGRNFAATTYGPGSSMTRTGFAPNLGNNAAPGIDKALRDTIGEILARRRRATAAPPQKLGGMTATLGGSGLRPDLSGRTGPAHTYDMKADQLANAQRGAEIDRLAALTGTAPTKTTTIGGSTFQSVDPLRMNAFQRQAFLPQSATGGEHVGSGFAPGSNVGEQDFSRFAAVSPSRLDPGTTHNNPDQAAMDEEEARRMALLMAG